MTREAANAIRDGFLGAVTGIVLVVALILIASPFLNWLLGYGFVWIWY